jgi:hypothetical protein
LGSRDAGRNKVLLLKVLHDEKSVVGADGHRPLPRGFGMQQEEFMTIASAALASPDNCPDTLKCAPPASGCVEREFGRGGFRHATRPGELILSLS